MQIVFAASECVPFAKTGGLADVVGALAPEMVKLGHDVTVYLPFYARVRRHIEGEPQYAVALHHHPLPVLQPLRRHRRWRQARRRAAITFVDCPELFDRQELYGTSDRRLS